MIRAVLRTVPLLLLVAAGSCSSPADESGAPADEAQQLNDAAASLDARGAQANQATSSESPTP